MDNYQLVICNFPHTANAQLIAETLLKAQLCACVNVLPKVESWYIWEGKLEHANEVTLLIKTTANHYLALEQLIKSLHPYQIPEIIALDVAAGYQQYLKWISTALAS